MSEESKRGLLIERPIVVRTSNSKYESRQTILAA